MSTHFVIKHRRRVGVVLMLAGAILFFRSTVGAYVSALAASDGVFVPDSTYVFAPVAVDGVASHTFWIYNARPGYLTVTAEPNCGCTGVSWKQTTIAPFTCKGLTASMKLKAGHINGPVSVALHTSSRTKPWLFVLLKQAGTSM